LNYIPDSDPQFDDWVKQFVDYVTVNFAAIGLTSSDVTELTTASGEWTTDYTAHKNAHAAAQSASQKKKATHDSLETLIRALVARIQANPTVTNDQKASLGITIPKEGKTPSPVPSTRPMAEIDNKNRLQHTINFFDEGNQKSKAKPAGVRGCEIWCKIGGTPPLDSTELKYLATDSKTPYIAHFEGADAGKTVHYMLRWINTRGETGPWSETISVTISA